MFSFLKVSLIFFIVHQVYSVVIRDCIFKRMGSEVIAENCDFFGNDITTVHPVHDRQHCLRECINWGNECTHYVYNGPQDKCHLKRGIVFMMASFMRIIPNLHAGIRCGLIQTKECREFLNDQQWVPSFFNGPPINFLRGRECYFKYDEPIMTFFNATIKDCANSCRTAPDCSHFNFLGGYCQLFIGEVHLEDVLQCGNSGCYCGKFPPFFYNFKEKKFMYSCLCKARTNEDHFLYMFIFACKCVK